MRPLFCLVLFLALLSLVPAAAQAEATFHTEAPSTPITGVPDGKGEAAQQTIEAAGSSLVCSGIELNGAPFTETTLKFGLLVHYSGCTFLGQPTTVKSTECRYLIVSIGVLFIIGGECTGISWEAASCSVQIPIRAEGATFEEVTYKNIKPGSFEEVTMEMHAKGIPYTASGKGCPESGNLKNGVIKGNVVLSAAASNFRWE